MRTPLLITFFFFLFIASSAQISGIVKDKKTGKPLDGVEVFINNSSWHAVSDKSGVFTLENIYPGFFDLVLYKKGFEIFKSSMRIQEGKLYKLNLELIPTERQPSVKVKRDEQWNTNYLWFLGGLLGSHEFARMCEVDNNSTLQFQIVSGTLQASASEPFTIKNLALGMQLRVYLQSMEATNASSEIRALISYTYQSSSDYQQNLAWERNRLKSYWGSSRHLFKSLLMGVSGNEGYTLYGADEKPLSTQGITSNGNMAGYYKLNLPNPVKVKFQIATIGSTVTAAEQLSEISFQEGFEVNGSGLPFSILMYEVKGAMKPFGLSAALPIDYEPGVTIADEKMDWKNFSMLREKVYLHTDRDYYYPRETLWFKSYVGYSLPLLRDTLSGVLYVDLISSDKERIDTRTYRIKEGVAWGEFRLSESLPAGEYYLRGYTNWMRNYGDSALFIKQIPILSLNTNIDQQKQEFPITASPHLQVKTDQESYDGRKQVALQIQLRDERGVPVEGNLSVAVTDAVASDVLNQTNITTPSVLTITDLGIDNKYFDEIKYYMERGLSFRGVVKDNKGMPTPAKIDIIQGNMDNLVSMETDDNGEFLVTGLHFTDSILFAFKPVNAKGKPLPRVDLLSNEIPEANFKLPPLTYTLKDDNAIQRIQNVYSPDKNAIMLKEVEVKSSRLAQSSKVEPVRIYGTADYVLKGDDIRSVNVGTNFLVGLQGKVPGLRVIESVGNDGFPTISVRVGRAVSFVSGTEPLILVDGIPFPDAQSISSLSASMVDRVEVLTRAAPQYGSRGSNGVIAIYTKQGAFFKESEPDYLSFKVPGYHKPTVFYSPDYSVADDNFKNPDFRTTIFWKPDLKVDAKGEATVNFYTADLATKYRIVVEGVTAKGTPVRSVTYITVE